MKVSTSQRENYVQSNLFDFFDNNKIDISVHRPASKIKVKKKIAKKPMISVTLPFLGLGLNILF